MGKKGLKKKKHFQRMCQMQAKKGMVNNALGEWKPASSHTMDKMLLAGYKQK